MDKGIIVSPSNFPQGTLSPQSKVPKVDLETQVSHKFVFNSPEETD